MIRTENKEQTITRSVVVSITCDRCGKETLGARGNSDKEGGQVNIGSFGYGSRHDGLYVMREICDDCVVELIDWFKKDAEPVDELVR